MAQYLGHTIVREHGDLGEIGEVVGVRGIGRTTICCP